MLEAATVMPAPRAATQAAVNLLIDGGNRHVWRARSLVRALRVISASAGPIEPDAIAALAERLEEHVAGMAAAFDAAHSQLTGAIQ